MIYPKIPLAQSIIEICLATGVTDIVISPGSRNAPLIIGFVNHPSFKCYSIADERSAAFFALGIAQQIQKPVAVVCTSGSALLNYYPAFAEAFYSQIPLVVISADRPLNKIDIGDGQTIRQQNVFSNHSLYNANLTEVADEINHNEILEAINMAIVSKGPVHINAPFEEPLYETTNLLNSQVKLNTKQCISVPDYHKLDNRIIDTWNSSPKIMILAGVNYKNVISDKNTDFLGAHPAVIVMTETTSNWHHTSFINNIDTIISPFSEKDMEYFSPDLLITFGGMIVSKRIKAFLRKYKSTNHWHIDLHRSYNTFDIEATHFKMTANDFFDQIRLQDQYIESDYFQNMNAVKTLRSQRTKEYLNKIPFSDFKAFEIIIGSLPQHSMFQISNSSPIRYAQLIDIDPTFEVYCNRGTSGIDGSTSTAIGAAAVRNVQTIFATGDIGFLYDSNALWNNYIPKNFKIILINNGGGGIFRILPGHQENQVFNEFFETPHCLTAEHLARMYGFEYAIASSTGSLILELNRMYENNNKPYLLEVFTPTLENDKILLQFFKELL